AGPQGPTGPTGEQGVAGPQGITGPAPDITVTEDTPTSYKLMFKSDKQEIASPNLRSSMECYNLNLSASGSTYNIPVGKLVFTVSFASTSSIRLVIRAADTSVPVLADIRRTSIYEGSSIESQTLNSTKISTNVTLDDTVYSMSQEMHWIRIRQQDPATSLWSMCEIRTFASAGGARTSVCIEWFYTGASFQTP
ncbi:MAG: collagen-like protein, partial [Clostridium sp.]|nr:collagen-like protein [Clostridium sp.]